SGPRTRTRPSTYAAISELVVPRSMPTIRSLITVLRESPRHHYLRRTIHLAIPFVTCPVDLENHSIRDRVRLFHGYGIHASRIKEFSLALNWPDQKFSQEIVQRLQRKFLAFFQRLNHIQRALNLLPAGAKDAVKKGRLQFLPGAHRLQAAQHALPHFQQRIQHLFAAAAFSLAHQRVAHLLEGPALE